MKVKDLIAELQECNPEDAVIIPIEKGFPTMGGTPGVELEAIYRGFDWDSRRVFLHVGDGNRLTLMSKEEYTSLIRYKQLVMGMRGKEELAGLSDIFVKKDFVIGRLNRLTNVEELETSEVLDLITDIVKEKL